jgi:hypothetical protein
MAIIGGVTPVLAPTSKAGTYDSARPSIIGTSTFLRALGEKKNIRFQFGNKKVEVPSGLSALFPSFIAGKQLPGGDAVLGKAVHDHIVDIPNNPKFKSALVEGLALTSGDVDLSGFELGVRQNKDITVLSVRDGLGYKDIYEIRTSEKGSVSGHSLVNNARPERINPLFGFSSKGSFVDER